MNGTSNAASGAAGKIERRATQRAARGQDMYVRKKQTAQRAARRASQLARRQPVKEMSDAMSSAASNLLDILCNKTQTPLSLYRRPA
jgi:hypothetical protein